MIIEEPVRTFHSISTKLGGDRKGLSRSSIFRSSTSSAASQVFAFVDCFWNDRPTNGLLLRGARADERLRAVGHWVSGARVKSDLNLPFRQKLVPETVTASGKPQRHSATL